MNFLPPNSLPTVLVKGGGPEITHDKDSGKTFATQQFSIDGKSFTITMKYSTKVTEAKISEDLKKGIAKTASLAESVKLGQEGGTDSLKWKGDEGSIKNKEGKEIGRFEDHKFVASSDKEFKSLAKNSEVINHLFKEIFSSEFEKVDAEKFKQFTSHKDYQEFSQARTAAPIAGKRQEFENTHRNEGEYPSAAFPQYYSPPSAASQSRPPIPNTPLPPTPNNSQDSAPSVSVDRRFNRPNTPLPPTPNNSQDSSVSVDRGFKRPTTPLTPTPERSKAEDPVAEPAKKYADILGYNKPLPPTPTKDNTESSTTVSEDLEIDDDDLPPPYPPPRAPVSQSDASSSEKTAEDRPTADDDNINLPPSRSAPRAPTKSAESTPQTNSPEDKGSLPELSSKLKEAIKATQNQQSTFIDDDAENVDPNITIKPTNTTAKRTITPPIPGQKIAAPPLTEAQIQALANKLKLPPT